MSRDVATTLACTLKYELQLQKYELLIKIGMTDDNCNNINYDDINDEFGNDDDYDDIEIDFKLDSDGRIALLSSHNTSSISDTAAETNTTQNEISHINILDRNNNNNSNASEKFINETQTIAHKISAITNATTESNTNRNDTKTDNTAVGENTSQLRYDTHVVETKLRFVRGKQITETIVAKSIVSLSDNTEIPKQIGDNNTDTRSGLDIENINDDNDSTLLEKLIWDELYYDCEICDNGLMPRTFWIGCTDTPRCSLEQIAYDIFQYHTNVLAPKDMYYDTSKSGAEWWVQIRPSPDKVGRYSMHSSSNNNNETNNNNSAEIDMTKDGISFHWDKDEELRLLCDGTTYVHPHLSTVTYLTSLGSPTLIINKRIHNLTGEWIDTNIVDQSSTTTEAFVTYPYQGKHLSFDGRYLHSAPYDLLYNGNDVVDVALDSNEQNNEISSTIPSVKSKQDVRSNRRITFLVNIWLNYIPMKTKRFPDTMIDKLSGYAVSCNINDDKEQFRNKYDTTQVIEKEIAGMVKNQRVGLSFQENVQLYNTTTTTIVDNTSIEEETSSCKRRRVDKEEDCTVVNPYHVRQVDLDLSQVDVGSNTVQYSSIKNNTKIEQFITTPIQTYDWPMGDCTSNEYVHADTPILPLQQVSSLQGNIRIRYNNNNNNNNNNNKNNILPTQQESSSSSKVSNATLLTELLDKNVGFIDNNHIVQLNNRFGLYLYRS